MSADVTEARDAQDARDALTAHHRFQVSLSDRLAGLEDPVAIQAVAARLLSEHLGTSRVQYAEVDETGTYATVTAEHQVQGTSTIGRYHLDDYGRSVVDEIRVGRTVVIDEVATDPRLDEAHRRATAALGIGSYVNAPVMNGGSLAAFMLAFHSTAHRWTPAEIEAVKDSGQRTYLALERARLTHEREARRSQAEFVTQLLTDLARFTDPAQQYQHLAQALVPGLADYATVEAPDADRPVLGIAHRDPAQVPVLRSLRERHRIDPSAANSITRAAHGETQLLAAITPAVRAEYAIDSETQVLLTQLGPRSHLAVPLTLGDGIDGALMVGLVEPDRTPYTSADLEFITDLTRRAGIVIAETAVRRSKHEIAHRLQRALLPDSLHWLPTVSIEAQYQSAADHLDVGGDWYDSYAWPSGHIAIMVGDIVGHDLSSAVEMGRLRSAAAALATVLPPDPTVFLEALDTFARGRDGTTFATVTIVVIDPSGTVSYATAGHPPPLLITPDGRCERLTDAHSPPLCALTPAARPHRQRTLAPGTLLLLYSDGLVERRGERLDTGIARLEHAAVGNQHHPLPALARQIMTAARPPNGFEDDVVLTLIRYTRPIAAHNLSIRAHTDQLALLRRDIRHCLDQQKITGREQRDIVLAISEAANNAIEHAYHGRHGGTIIIDLEDHSHHVIARITDHGTWRPPTPDPERRRGIPIMQSLATHYARTSSAAGTTITLEIPTPTRLYTAHDHDAFR